MKKKAQYMAIDEWPDGNDNLKKKNKNKHKLLLSLVVFLLMCLISERKETGLTGKPQEMNPSMKRS